MDSIDNGNVLFNNNNINNEYNNRIKLLLKNIKISTNGIKIQMKC